MRLAIVEDDDKVRQQLQTYVLQYFQGRENDVDIRLFADGDEILEDYAADYDLIFLDIQMKRLDGLATAERIRERDEDVYLVFITNLANYAIRGYAVHALDFILKPVNFLMLRQVLISVENFTDKAIDLNGGQPVTTKENKESHGYGIKSIRKAAEKYGGCMTLEQQDGWFIMTVLIPLAEEKK